MSNNHWKLSLKQVVILGFSMVAFSLWLLVGQVQASTNIEVKKLRELRNYNENYPSQVAYNGHSYIYKDNKSEDGLTWYGYHRTVYDENNKLIWLNDQGRTIWDGNKFVTIGSNDNMVVTSQDGLTWHATRIPHKDPDKMYIIQDFVFVNGTYYFVAQDRPIEIYMSPTLGGGFYVAGPNAFFSSKDLKNFKLGEKEGLIKSFNGERPIWNLSWTGKYFLGNGNAPVMSKDGVHWFGPESDGFITEDFPSNMDMAWDGKKFVSAYENEISTSVDGLNWKTVFTTPSEAKVNLQSVGFNGKEYIAVGYGSVYYYSLDGVRWDEIVLDSKGAILQSVYPMKDGFLAVGDRVYNIKNQDLHTPSSWAASDILKATKQQLVPAELLSYYKSNITREEFSKAVVQLYEALTGETSTAVQKNPFVDTTDSSILKAHKLGIVQGRENGKFVPNDPISRQDMSVMLYKTLLAADVQLSDESTDWSVDYRDVEQVAAYAEQALRYFNHNKIINGKENSQLVPRGNASKEEAIVLVGRVFEKFNTRPIVEHVEIIPSTGIEAVKADMMSKGYSLLVDYYSREGFIYYELKDKEEQIVVEYEQVPESYRRGFGLNNSLSIDYIPKQDDYKLKLIQDFIESHIGAQLPGLRDELKMTLDNVDLEYGKSTGEIYTQINGVELLYLVFSESDDEEYILEIVYHYDDNAP